MKTIRLRAVLACVVVAILWFTSAGAQSAGTWSQLPDGLAKGRAGHTATAFPDGRIAIMGGENQAGVLSTVEVYNQTTHTFGPAGTLLTPRVNHTATLLKNGLVLISGGKNAGVQLSSTELYDPETGTSVDGPPMTRLRAGHSATILPNGSVLLLGGDTAGTAEIYDPTVNAITPVVAATTAPRTMHGAVLLANGKVLVAGGVGADGAALNTAEIFDPASMTFLAVTATMSAARRAPSLNLLPDGKVQVIGGDIDGSMEMFSPDTGAFNGLAYMPPSAPFLDATLMTASRDALFSPYIARNLALQGLAGCDADLNTCDNADLLALLDRTDHTVTTIPYTKGALIAGGIDPAGAPLTSAYVVAGSPATVTTDRTDYAPGETVTITGTGFQPGETVNIALHERPDAYVDPALQAVADESGKFTAASFAPALIDIGRTFTLTAIGHASGFAAQTVFTDDNPNASITVTASPGGAIGGTFSITRIQSNGNSQTSGGTTSQTYGGTQPGSGFTISSIQSPVNGCLYTGPATVTGTIGAANTTTTVTLTYSCAKDLTVSKTATGTFNRAYLWGITKLVDQSQVDLFPGDSVTSNYTVNVAQTGISDSGWKVSGKITVGNTNPFDVSLTSITDVIDNGGTCTVGTGPYTVPGTGSLEINYSCSYASAPTSYGGKNTATITWDKNTYHTASGTASASADFIITQVGSTNKTVHVTDSYAGSLGTVTASDSAPFATSSFTYDRDDSCPILAKAYINGIYSHSAENIATIAETGQNASASLKVNCYVPVVSKTAAGSYDERHEWDVTKSVLPGSQSAFVGDTVSYEWTVTATESVFEENFAVAGKISIQNPNPGTSMVVTVSDVLDDGSVATITGCTGGSWNGTGKTVSIPANSTASCSYAAAPTGRTAALNTATANLNGVPITATANVSWSSNVIRASATLDDDQNPAFPVTITEGGTWTYTEQYSCSTNKAAYDPKTHKYTFSESNTATLKSGDVEKGATASTSVDCYVPTISKTANGTYDEVHDWQVFKTVNTTEQTAFAGEKKNFTWTVRVEETTHGESYVVAGQITVVNPNPEDALIVTISDVLNDKTAMTIGPCTGGTWSSPDLIVPAGGTATCDYSGAPKGDITAFAAALPATVTMSVVTSYDGGPSYFPVVTVSNDAALNGTYEGWSGDIDHAINPGTNHTATVYSSYETLPEGLIENSTNMKAVNWIINQDYVGKPAGGTLGNYTYGDVQRAIWELLEDNPTDTTIGLGSWNQSRVDQIKRVAHENGERFVPACGDYVAVILQPVDGQAATIVPVTFAGLGLTCSDSNSVTAVLNGVEFTASANILWTVNKINETASLDDDQKPDWPTTVSADTTFTYQDPQGYTCSTDPAAYTNGFYQYNESNTAVLAFATGSKTATATTAVKCYGPTVTKTAETYWNRKWDWTISKDYDGSYNLFPGDTVTHHYKVSVSPTSTDNLWGVKGTITVANLNPAADMVLTSLTDLAGGINGSVTCPSLTVPKAGSLTCTYDTGAQTSPNSNPFGGINTATAAFAGANWSGTAPIVFSTSPTTETTPIITVDDDNLTGENWRADRAAGEWVYDKDFACSTNPANYDGGKYAYSLTNTARINETGQTDAAKVDIACYWPQVDLTKTGDKLSKIGDSVTYNIKLENNTPIDAALRALSCTVNDSLIGFDKTVTLASGASDTSTKPFTVPTNATDPFINTASVTCKPVAATPPVLGSSTFSVSDTSSWTTNLFQPAVEVAKTGPLYATSGDTITYTFTINNKSSSDSPNLMLDSISDNVLGDLKAAALTAGCDNLVYDGTCTFTVDDTVPNVLPDAGGKAIRKKNTVKVLYHPAGFPNDVTDTDDHTVTVLPKGQLTDSSLCALPNNQQFRLLDRLEVAPNIYRLQASNPGQFYFNGFYAGTPGSDFTMTIQVPYPFVTQEGAGNPIQVHDGTDLTTNGCFLPSASVAGFTIATPAMSPVSAAGNQIITPEDYATKNLGGYTTVTVTGKVPASGLAYVTIHLDYALKKTGFWKPTGNYTTNPVNGASIGDVNNAAGFGSGAVTIHGYEAYNFARTVGAETATTIPSSYNEFKKFAGFLGFVTDSGTEQPMAGVQIVIYDPKNAVLTKLLTDQDGYYMFPYKHTAKSAIYTVKLPVFNKSTSVAVKANGFAGVDFEITP